MHGPSKRAAVLLLTAGAVALSLGVVRPSTTRSEPVHARDPHPLTRATTIGGTKRLKGNFVVPRGRTEIVSRNLTIIARGKIKIAGTLLMKPGTRVILVAGGSILVHALKPMPASALHGERANARPAQSSCWSIPSPIVLVSGATSAGIDTLSGNITGQPGQDIDIAFPERQLAKGGFVPATVQISGSYTTANGQNAANPSCPGQNAGDINVGNAAADAAAPKVGPGGAGVHYASAGSLRNTGVAILAGNGGRGANADTTTPPSSEQNGCFSHTVVWTVQASNGGNGGNIRIVAATTPAFKASSAFPGSGGDGGSVTTTGGLSGGHGHAGVDVHFATGSGGRGGTAYTVTDAGTDVLSAGYGGAAGGANVGAGTGGLSGCEGGNLVGKIGNPGRNGVGLGPEPPDARAAVIHVSGGWGGDSIVEGIPGGKGGNVVLTDPDGKKPAVALIALTSVSNGGQGYSDCVGGVATAAGEEGGAGGALQTLGADYQANGSFNGGRGGDGEPYGRGGPPGTADTSGTTTLSFAPGADGNPCSPAETSPATKTPTPTNTPTPTSTVTPTPLPRIGMADYRSDFYAFAGGGTVYFNLNIQIANPAFDQKVARLICPVVGSGGPPNNPEPSGWTVTTGSSSFTALTSTNPLVTGAMYTFQFEGPAAPPNPLTCEVYDLAGNDLGAIVFPRRSG